MKKKIIVAVSGIFVLFIMLIGTVMADTPVDIYFNEVAASNGSTLKDEDGEYVDWIELYNAGDESISLEGYSLSDQKEIPGLWTFPNVLMEPDSYLIVYASGKNRAEAEGPLHTNFKISAAGENIYLSNSDGQLISSLSVEKVAFDKSYGRVADTEEYAALLLATPGEQNTAKKDIAVVETEEISFSLPAGYYDDTVFLELETEEKEAEIYYTLDGSVPDTDSYLYTGEELPIYNRTEEENLYTNIWCTPVDFERGSECVYGSGQQYKATVIKARLYFPRDDCWSENVWTSTYLIGADYTMPIVSLSVSEELLFDEWSGIYVPGKAYDDFINSGEERPQDLRFWSGNYWDDKKVSGYLEYFQDGIKVMENEITLRICGAASRGNAQKSFTVYAWGEGDDSFFSYPVFGTDYMGLDHETMDSFSSLRIRAFGNDSRRSMFRDALSQELVADLNLGTQGYQPCILLINGEYFGVYEIRENRDEKFFEEHFGITEGNLVKTELFKLTEENANEYETEFLELIDFVKKNDLYLEVNYEYVKSQIDVEQFIDYMITEQYLNNIDWPSNNIIVFRSIEERKDSEYEDCKWRFVFYDADYAINYQSENNFETVKNTNSYASVLLYALLENEEFYSIYVNRFEELLETNFEPSRAIAIQEAFENEFAPEIEKTLNRWSVFRPDGTALKEITVDYWYEKMDDLRKFFAERPEYAREYFYKELD